MPEPSSRAAEHSSAYAPLPVTSEAAQIRVGTSAVGIVVGPRSTVEVTVGAGGFGSVSLAAADVTRWCAETSVLMEVTLDTSVGDEIRIRTPMLVGSGGFCLALVRQDTQSGSGFVVAVAASAAAMARDEQDLALRATPDELRMLLMALERAASAATMSRNARG